MLQSRPVIVSMFREIMLGRALTAQKMAVLFVSFHDLSLVMCLAKFTTDIIWLCV